MSSNSNSSSSSKNIPFLSKAKKAAASIIGLISPNKMNKNPISNDSLINFNPLPLNEMINKINLIKKDIQNVKRPNYQNSVFNLKRTTPPNKLINPKGDGNCLFRCFSLILTGIEMYHKEIREAICNYMEKDESNYWSLRLGNAYVLN